MKKPKKDIIINVELDENKIPENINCLLYTSDAADDL